MKCRDYRKVCTKMVCWKIPNKKSVLRGKIFRIPPYLSTPKNIFLSLSRTWGGHLPCLMVSPVFLTIFFVGWGLLHFGCSTLLLGVFTSTIVFVVGGDCLQPPMFSIVPPTFPHYHPYLFCVFVVSCLHGGCGVVFLCFCVPGYIY